VIAYQCRRRWSARIHDAKVEEPSARPRSKAARRAQKGSARSVPRPSRAPRAPAAPTTGSTTRRAGRPTNRCFATPASAPAGPPKSCAHRIAGPRRPNGS
jgi:hypothetical protein